MSPSIQLYRDRFPGRSVLDTAVSHALLRRVGSGRTGESLRLYRPDNALLFSSLDARRDGYDAALEIARAAGFEPVIRLAGGHAAVFLESALAFAWATPDPDANLHIRHRFEKLTGWFAEALRGLGLDARVGEVPGEYCPGEYSINLGGQIKILGVGQRVIRGAAHVGGVLTIGQTETLREILIPIYDALDLEFTPQTAGGLVDIDPSLSAEDVVASLTEVLESEGYALSAGHFDSELEAEAEVLAKHHDAGMKTRSRSGGARLLQASQGKALIQTDTDSV
ncbi:MAG: biotin/lipoate A/B protein ligase family protein [Myxococcota bacterium]